MIIDLILDRKDGQAYNPKQFYSRVTEYESIFDPSFPIANALDGGTEEDIKKQLSLYIIKNDYNYQLINYINSQNWLN